MTDLNLLRVSLTKHGAHKLATLFEHYDSSNVLNHLWGSHHDVKIELAQAKKNLSARGNIVPQVWDEARARGSETVQALVLIGIIFSHRELISAMAESTDEMVPFSGIISRGNQLDGKAFTNFAHTLEQLGYTTEHSVNHVRYDLGRLFKIEGLNELAIKLLVLKLKAAAWDEKKSPIEELVSHDFHKVFSISAVQFEQWLLSGTVNGTDVSNADLSFFEQASDAPENVGFNFKSGHNVRKTGKIPVAGTKPGSTADLIHNKMQNKLFEVLVKKYGPDYVGTEVPTGADTAIDVVVKTPEFCWFYEIKTADTVKACIRQALPQLLEYAYWHGKTDLVSRLIIIGPAQMTKEAGKYLTLLRDTFGLPVSYEFMAL
ncbi:hypothetical protein [Collimonas sp.]|jgi:hypothetical protein|uniref:hypothetical protein n=1 Tax=Collimonas sp. TaxID=1963772 RepID=UPI002C0BBD33|nr:hypothetical protein [Collimonas sp.]HWX02414.1 hypothetical protein [Collimonas sp.]